MTFEEFDKFQAELLKEVVVMKNTKGKEYASETDRFANFNQDAAELGVDRLTAAMIFCNKHIRSIKQAIKTKTFTGRAEPLRGRFVDVIVYMTLIAGMIAEDENERTIKQFNNVFTVDDQGFIHTDPNGNPSIPEIPKFKESEQDWLRNK